MNQSQNLPQDMFQFPELQMMCKETLYCALDESACLLCLTKQDRQALIEHKYNTTHALIG